VPSPDPAQYDSFATQYEEHAAAAPYNALYDRPATLRLVGDVEGKRVLDAACGPGFYIEELLARNAEALGCDASPAMIDLARARVGDRAHLRVHSLEDPFTWIESATVDVVLCALAYHYVTDRIGFLREVHRVLHPDGSLVVSTHHPTADWCRLGGSYFEVSAVTEIWSKGWEITAWKMPLTQLTEEFATAGFTIPPWRTRTPKRSRSCCANQPSSSSSFARSCRTGARLELRRVPSNAGSETLAKRRSVRRVQAVAP
jgi:SAM-dependent methyltransferase